MEGYTLDTNTTRAVNVSTRGRVGVGEEVLIGGFIINDGPPKKVIVRALGPSLGAGGTGGVLMNPLVELRDSAGNQIAMNDDWSSGPQQAEIIATGIPPSNPLESAAHRHACTRKLHRDRPRRGRGLRRRISRDLRPRPLNANPN